jgi:2-iminoacetate synthase ThiH
MKKQFTMGRNNLSITIMIPSDCYNACPFCESKVEYAKHKVNLPNVIQSLQRLFDDSNTQKVKEVVITGGCHAYFGAYGEQDGDKKAAITREEQIGITVDEILQFINN